MILLWSFLLVTAALEAGGEDLNSWPMEGRPAVTSSFGEYRPGRLHMGVDFSTGGATGRPVRALGDGWVVRARCSPWGYGKAVYIRLDSGYTVVYGHLSDFRADIRDAIRAAQHARKSYTVDLTFRPGEFPVQKGEIIARSGDTGIGPAHLHVEMRDEAERPVDPRRTGLPWPPDADSPKVYAVALYPADPDSRVNHTCFPLAVKADRTAAGRYRTPPIPVTGQFYLGAAVQDMTPEGNRLGVWRASVKQGDERLFELQFNRLSYENQESGALCFDPSKRVDGVPVMQVWRRPGNTLDIFTRRGEDGAVAVRHPAEPVLMEFEDFGGNVSIVEIPLREDTGPAVQTLWPIEEGFFHPHRGVAYFSRAGADAPVTARFSPASGSERSEQIPLVKMGEGFGMWWQPSRPGIWELALSRGDGVASTFRLACSGGQEEMSLDGENFKFTFPPGSLPPETCVRAEPERVSGVSELDLLGDGVTLIPEYVPILKPFTVRMRGAGRGADGQTAIYRVSGKSATWLKTQRAGEWLVAESSASGSFAVAADRQAPTAGPWKITAREEAPNRPRICVAVADRGSGISEWALYCGDRWLLSAYDPDAGEIIWEGDEELPGPAADLRLTLTDRAGNRSAWTYETSPERRAPAKKSAKSKKQ